MKAIKIVKSAILIKFIAMIVLIGLLIFVYALIVKPWYSH